MIPRALAVLLATAAAIGGVASCSSIDPEATITTACPDAAGFELVAPVVEASCGTLDCHGQTARPLRIYGERGMRLAAADLPGEAETTVAERIASRRSICSLQPEQMARVVAGEAGADALLLVQKARAEVHHKGGAPVAAGDATDACITSWLEGAVDSQACAAAPVPDP